MTVAVRHYLLAGSALLVLVLVVLLYREVRSSPVAPAAPSRTAQRDEVPEIKDEDDKAVVSKVNDRAKPPTPGTLDKIVKRPATDEVAADDKAEKPTQTTDTVKLEAVMDEANKAYDRSDLDEARTIAQKVLKQQPTNTRMLRIMVSAACIEGDGPEAQKYYNLLPKADRDQMKTRCARYTVTFTEPPAAK